MTKLNERLATLASWARKTPARPWVNDRAAAWLFWLAGLAIKPLRQALKVRAELLSIDFALNACLRDFLAVGKKQQAGRAE